ncbi:alpha/beta hydrolase [Pseudonocardia alaniniphila]|uniref:Alpha/beta hydrolase n=1 Tax=Pseudonocardia alaniniphila TaxID=75291 RepID=A0ABS9T9D1_9PSEU|nr:alpha/beta hydrolase [Pseudonocardia alaniniphila]MCH6165142.1 alpha/beta hydrolase [Pseudonocardia alaniniphila]
MSAGVLLLAVGACAAPVQPVAAPEPASAAPAPELAPFYDQQIVFEPCAPYATTSTDEALFADKRFDCARVDVPLDYADPDGPRGQIALLRAIAQGERIGTLLVNPGGPGGSGMNMVAIAAPKWDDLGVGDRFDVIGFDPRGVGASTPQADCYTDAEQDAGLAVNGAMVPAPRVPDAAAAEEVAWRCVEATGGVAALTSVSTTNTVQDMDVLRAVLGEETLSYLGYSYGSELGAVYAESFPERVRAMVLDGGVDPEASPARLSINQYAAAQQSLEALAAECAEGADCPLGTDPARVTETFQGIVRPLIDEPLPTTDGRALSYDAAVTGVLAGLRADRLRPMVIEGLRGAAAGRGDILLQLNDLLLGRQADGRYALDLDSLLAIRCMDNPRRTPAEQTDMLREIHAAAPMIDPGRPVTEAHHECEAWPAQPDRPERWLTGEVDVPPTLVVSVTGDTATPYEGGVSLARALDASLLTVEGDQHGISLFGQNDCVDRIAIDYLVDLRTPPADARCGG